MSFGVALGLAGGLIEGVGHMALQRLNVGENVWYQIIWIAAVFDGLLLGGLGLLLCVVLWLFPGRPRLRTFAIFLLIFAITLPTMALMLKEWVYHFAIFLLTLGISVSFTRWVSLREDERLQWFRRRLPAVVILALLACVGIEGGLWLRERVGTAALTTVNPSAPDVVVIVIDTLRADHLSSYGYARSTSPHIDKLAAEGVLFEHAFSTSSYTLPSHVSLLTGLFPHEHHVEWDNLHAADVPGHPTLAETLQARGYRTGAFSGNRFYFTREQGFGRGFLHFDDFFQSPADMMMRTAYGRMASVMVLRKLGYEDLLGRKTAADTNDEVLRWMDRGEDHPQFVFINYMDAHDPYAPPDPYLRRYSRQANPQSVDLTAAGNVNQEQVQSVIDAYDGSVAYVDDQIGQLMTALQRRRSARDLLVVVTSDHGEAFQEHGLFTHGHSLDWEVIHVPLIIWWPGRVPAGMHVRRPVSNAALPSTVLEALGLDRALFPGPPLQRLWEDPDAGAHWPEPLSELKRQWWARSPRPIRSGSMRSLVSSSWHYIEHDTRGPALFNWMTDPREAANLATQPEMRPVLDSFREQLKQTTHAAPLRADTRH